MDTAQWAQGIGVVKQPTMEGGSKPPPPPMLERRARPQKDQALNCPRCNSTNTKFCYYNNYSLSQPRYFCKTCRRYWTEGGSLRNVPVGGGSRKNKRSTPSAPPPSSASAQAKKLPDLTTPNFPQSASQDPKIHQGQDLNLAYPPAEDYNTVSMSKLIEVPYNTELDKGGLHQNPTSSSTPTSASSHHQLSAMELLKTGIAAASSRGLNSFMPMYNSTHHGFPLQDFKPPHHGLNFSLEGFDNGTYGGLHQGIQEDPTTGGARILFPTVEDLKQQVPSTNEFDHQQNRSQEGSAHGYWNGMLGGGSW
ncbi:dof zinc finger protein DOF2.5-like isoform X1 [Glycine soja]|uniref:Dof zinc finger protein n=3 Tax=Glycine subgen. Soja TaxID=1462606 RepID=Q0GLD0_SOYBN|nr:dof zinc finger protein DOF2.5-like isoform X1 [Glycine soja]ABI16023.1 Dof28 [Glycine max]KAG5019231.1 hypothetical protein JHK87_015086 [Glycine soja]RZC07277.1 Dof zinc finger protein DOF3.7 isoform A [Glycine soja]|eukprot:NP_001236794.1 Dof21b [Glycine max]